MADIRFMHCADLHLGAKYSMLPRRVADIRRQQQREAFAAAVDLAINPDARADIVLIAGDSFDAAIPPLRELSFFNQQLRRLKDNGVRTFLIPGNHDAYEEGSWWDRTQPAAEVVFKRPGLQKHVVPSLDLTVAALPPDPARSSVNLLKEARIKVETGRSVLLAHATWLNFGRDECGIRTHPFDSKDLVKLPVSYVALGHYHGLRDATQRKGPKAFYPGSPEATTFTSGCEDAGNVLVGTIADDGTVEVQPQRVARGRHRRLRIDCTNESPESLERAIGDDLAENDFVLAELHGVPSAETAAAASELAERLQGRCTYLSVATAFTELGHIPEDNVFFGKFHEAIEDRLAAAPGEDKAKWLRALELGTVAFLSSQDR